MKFLTIAIMAFSINAYAHFSAQCTGLTDNRDGDELSTNPSAQSDSICPGQSTQLFALPSGGVSNYTFSWVSDPPGFSSTLPDPFVYPLVSTVYTVTVNDGLNTVTGNVTVTVNPLPIVNLLPDNPNVRVLNASEISVCAFDSVTLDAGNPGSAYEWDNGANTRTITIQTSGISYDLQKYEVMVTDPLTRCTNTGSISVQFTFSDCSYGLEEKHDPDRLKLYPNPSSDGLFNCVTEMPGDKLTIEVYTSHGSLIRKDVIHSDHTGNFSSTIDLRNQTPGVYLLRASDRRSVIMRKLIIRR